MPSWALPPPFLSWHHYLHETAGHSVNVEVLIDAIVRQTTVLVAQLATSTGHRSPLAHTANQVFSDLVKELKTQGVANAVIADMFGLTLRTYHKKLRRLSESETFRGQSLWTAVHRHIQENGPLNRSDVFLRFRNDDETTLRSVLSDMVDAGVLYVSGKAEHTTYRAMDTTELSKATSDAPETLQHLVWVAVYRFGPLSLQGLADIVPAPERDVEGALDVLTEDGRVEPLMLDGKRQYKATHCYIPVASSAGWEASVFDHYQAVVTTVCRKLASRHQAGTDDDRTGGSTYRFTVWPGHPHRRRVFETLTRMRQEMVQLRQDVESYNQEHDASDEDAYEHVVSYVGQAVLSHEPEEKQ